MELDKETVENLITNLSKVKFDGICRVILEEYFHLDILNMDRRGDGGGDWITIPYGGGKRAFVAQATIQATSWKTKCIKDAEKAVENFGCRKYLFLTSRRRDSVDLLSVENEIQDKFDIPASCLGAVEIAEILITRKLVSKAFLAAGLDAGVSSDERPDRSEQLVFSALSLSSGAAALRNEVHDEAILYVLSSQGPRVRDALIAAVIETLQCGEHREGRINSRIDSLLTRGALKKDPLSQHLELSENTCESLQLAKAIYEEQFSDLSNKINSVIKSFGFSVTDIKTLSRISIYASRAMIAGTIKSASKAGVEVHNTLLLEQLGEPHESLREIVSNLVISKNTIDQIVEEILTVTQAHPLVLRLSQELLHFAIDGINPVHNVRALGVSSWSVTETLLDASVAIPFLCSQITRPSSGRFSRGAIAGIAALQKAGSSLFIPRDYLNEAAVHLLHAVEYCRPFTNSEVLVASPNGFVSHYYTLKRDGAPIPPSLINFLLLLAPSLRNAGSPHLVTQIMNDLECRFSDLGISTIYLDDIDRSYINSAHYGFDDQMYLRRSREGIRLDHDVRTVAWMKKCRAQGQFGKLCLTWDELMISVVRADENAGWFVTPHQASDLITMGSRRDEGALLAVLHDLAATRAAHENLVGNILDDVIGYARAGKLEWEVISELSKLRQNLHERALKEGVPGEKELRSIADDFWKRHGIDVNAPHERTSVTREDIENALAQSN